MSKSAADATGRVAELEAELKNERAQFALAERAGRLGYWRFWLADGRTSWSPGMYRILGIDPGVQAADNEWLASQIHPDDVVMFHEKINDAIRKRAPFSYRTRSRYPEAMAQIVDTHGDVEVGPDGRVISVVGVCYDVTKEVFAEALRAQAEKRNRIMMEEASDIIMLYGPDGNVEFVSSALERILGRTSHEFDNLGYLKMLHPEDRAEAEKISIRPSLGETRTGTYRVRHADGHYVWFEVTTRSVYDDETGEFRHIVAVSRDVTARKAQELEMTAAREAAEAANRAKSSFLANMSHELRTPLNAILGFTDIMRGEMFGPIDNPRYREYVALIHNSGELLLDLIGDVLDMAKIEAGKLQLNFENVSLTPILGECVQIMADKAKTGEIDLRLAVEDIALSADRRAIKQIVLNLLSNAIKFTPAGGRVEIAAKLDGRHVCIAISDTGIGIAPQDIPRLARPFEQVCDDPRLAKKGTGLGLALVRALVEKHGGRLAIDSKLQRGTTVTVELPRFRDREESAA